MSDTLQKETIRDGNGIDKPQAGDTVTMDYTGWLYEKGQADNRGTVCGQP
jgi:FK506-binding protein 1